MKAVSFGSLFMSNKTWLSWIIWSCLLLISIGLMSYLFYFVLIKGHGDNYEIMFYSHWEDAAII